MKKRGQVAIFVVVAVVIVAAVLLIYFLIPGGKTILSGDLVPANYLQTCFQSNLDNNVRLLSSQGGYENPQGYALYNNYKVKYLCYTAQYYLPCKVQQPLIVRNFEIELARMTNQKVVDCVNGLKREYESKGYTVTLRKTPETEIEMTPDKIKVIAKAPMTISKDGTQNFDEFEVDVPSKMYNLLMISTSIVSYESTYGNTDTDIFRAYYPNLDIDKIEREGGTTIFKVRDVTTDEEFTFASRSLAWPGGYGVKT